ncbi:hypothetical protein EVC12_058 [Rhizobium phage RHph_I42]|nr:hypothetical protein EVC12_058 [Rhizobium phage RHph_I42]
MAKTIKLNTGKMTETPVTEKKHVKTIDCTPTWSSILPTWLMIYEEGNAEGRKNAVLELSRMAAQADAYLAIVKERQTDGLSHAGESVSPSEPPEQE